jgi:hypothetical protein
MGNESRLTRSELYALVWSEPMSTLAPKHGLSDVGMAKICRRLRVPRPWRGYWARKDAGQTVKPTPLPKLPASSPTEFLEVTIHRGVVKSADKAEGPVADQARFEALPENRISVAAILSDPHPLVALTVKALRGAKSHKGVLVPKSKQCLAIRVSIGCADRAACIFDALLKSLDVRGFTTSLRERNEKTETVVRIAEEDIEILLEETVSRREARHPQYGWAEHQWVPTGKLVLRIENYWSDRVRKSWGDGDKQRVEECLNAFIVSLTAVAEKTKIHRLEMEERQREFQEAERRRQQEAQRRAKEAEEVRALDSTLAAWEKAQRIRVFVAALGELHSASTASTFGDVPIPDWIAWATEYANHIDPLVVKPPVSERAKSPGSEWELPVFEEEGI